MTLSLDLRDVRTIYTYNRTVFDRYARRVRKLPERVAHRKRGIGHESLFDTLVHILNVHEVWLGYVVWNRTSDPELQALFDDQTRHPKDWKGFDRYSKRVWAAVDASIARLSPKELARPVNVFWMPGHYTVRDGVLQATLEQAHHLGEMIGALWQDDIEPPEMTWIDTNRAIARRNRRA